MASIHRYFPKLGFVQCPKCMQTANGCLFDMCRATQLALPDTASKPKQIFHVHRLLDTDADAVVMRSEYTAEFDIIGMYAVTNDASSAAYAARRSTIEHIRGPENLNEKAVFHVSGSGDLFDLFQTGLDPRRSRQGLFGKGIHLACEPEKANDYSADKGNPAALRTILRCRVLQGVAKEFELGRFDRDLVIEPPGCDSVVGYVRRGPEVVVYSRDQVIITHAIVYRYTNPLMETSPARVVPPNVQGHVVFITAALSEFFAKLTTRAGPDGSDKARQIKHAVGRLLKAEISAELFLDKAGTIFNYEAPPLLAEKIRAELVNANVPVLAHDVNDAAVVYEPPRDVSDQGENGGQSL